MIIDIWSDVVCPWCFIGKRRLEKALSLFEHRDEVVIRHRAFQLQPDIDTTQPTKAYLAEKYRMAEAQVEEMQANVCAIADGEGLCYNLDETLSGNTFDAHRLLLWAQTIGKQDELLEVMYSAYFEKSLPLFSHEDLIQVCSAAGIKEGDVRAILQSDDFSPQVLEDRALATQLGATGVPFFVIDMKYGISGAQPLEAFTQTLNTAWQESHA
ncbi:MAG: DsbA family oxidoreductase [Candidatus Planktophila sp.]|jgi:predicted DsbA family dithiol-disulfide isomerase|nr:DsbA family oxidoreductase [Candidatus Planktophila sp.]